MKLIKIAVFVCSALILGFSLFSCGVDVEEEPGTIEEMGNPAMEQVSAAHEAADPSDDEIVIYYYRPDGEYEPWAIWLWAFPDGDGSVNWPYTQDFEVAGGVGYMKFSMDGSDLEAPPVGQDGDMGFIIRQDSEWIKDGEQDRIWNVNVSNEIVVFSEDQESYAYGPYVPTFQEARMIDATQLRLELSGRHAVEPAPDSNGFVVRSADESIEYEIQDMVNFVYRDDRSRNYSDLYLVTLAQPVDPSVPLEVYHEEYLQPMRIDTSSLVVESAEQTIPPADYRLGAVYNEGSVEFRVWSPFARSITAQLYTESGASSPVYEVVLEENDATGVWTGTFSETDPEGMFYDYEVTSSAGVRTALDPYAMSMDAYRNEGGAGRGAIINMDAPEAQPPGGWEGHTDYALDQREDAIIYEMSVRDFTISPDSDVSAAPGTYNAFIEKLPYLQDLGITHIQLMPVLNFYYTDETDRSYEDDGTASDNNYNWGYDPHNYFTPEGWYASDATDPYARVRELRNLIKEIHAHDMGVLLDVVYNHMANPMLLEDIVPYYYFRRTPAGSYTSNSGCGNDIATSRTMARRLITDSIFHWVSQYNIDGFRFDLMGLMDTETVLAARELVAALPEKADILFEGEGWQMYNGPGNTAGMDQD
ncbi:MAG: alpha-amylase family glycosyl hydrolase, partial [Spirochaetia bacterium]